MQVISVPCGVRVNLTISSENIGKLFWKAICIEFMIELQAL